MNYIDANTMPLRNTGAIRLHGPEGFEGMRKAGNLSARCLDMLVDEVKPGVTTGYLDDLAREFLFDHDSYAATMLYRGYRHSLCTSINHVVCHGIPTHKKPLKDGDILNIDITSMVDGWHGDTSRMFVAGEAKRKASRLMDITYECLMRGIAEVKPGATTGDIGAAIQEYAESQRCSVVEAFCGHGLGKLFHDAPNILHYGKRGTGPELKAGMIFTIEPMINLGKKDVALLPDGWTAVTRDRSLTAQFEHSIGVTEDGCEIFTKSPTGIDTPHTV
ncbi:type I methionyl aminopeptidase [Hirschia maritima]|uniref:type I methionyl aminopeptidase n=1 Tax=Hirschia maritima TaxID=1121961 RepID=UPI00036EF017|nr:type I methionyl aminopeptidase [Hirschia maritima]